jgi:beta-lactamase class A
MIDRRIFLSGALGALLMHSHASADEATDKFTALEKAIGGRLGVCILDTGNGKKLSHRGDERFALLSTFKALAAGCVLARVDRGEERLDRRVKYTQADVLSYAPVAKLHVADGMTMAEICDAAIGVSDNTAGNLQLASFGGPAGLTKWLRSIGDDVTRLDRTEPTLNEAKPGDPRDTTTPNAVAGTWRKLLTGDALRPARRGDMADRPLPFDYRQLSRPRRRHAAAARRRPCRCGADCRELAGLNLSRIPAIMPLQVQWRRRHEHHVPRRQPAIAGPVRQPAHLRPA